MVYADYHTQMSGVQLICPVSRRNLSWKLATVKFLDAPLMFSLAFQATFQLTGLEMDTNATPVRLGFVSIGILGSYPIGSMYGIYTNIGGILMVNVTIYTIHGSYGYMINIDQQRFPSHSYRGISAWRFRSLSGFLSSMPNAWPTQPELMLA
jgi:hypothetical protein